VPGDNPSEFLLAEYCALRAEILALEERATNIQIAGLTGIPTLLAAGDYWHLSFLIIFGPAIIVVAALMLIFIQDSIMRDGKYIKDCIEPHS
jgi:low affinity Fe/Cu permease